MTNPIFYFHFFYWLIKHLPLGVITTGWDNDKSLTYWHPQTNLINCLISIAIRDF